MSAPSFQFYPGDWRKNANLRRCSPAARGAWIDVLCVLHDSDTYGLVRWPLTDLANASGAPLKLLKELVDKSVLKGCDRGECQAYVYTPKSGRKEGDPVVLVPAQKGPIWFSSRMVKDEYVRTVRGGLGKGDGGYGDAPKGPPNDSPKGGFGEGKGGGIGPYARGRSPSSSASASASPQAKQASDPPKSREAAAPAGLPSGDPKGEGKAATRLGEVCIALRKAGVRCGPDTAGVADIVADERITAELIATACELLDERKGKGGYGPPLVLLKAVDLLDPKPQHRQRGPDADFSAWRTDDGQCDRLGKSLGLWPNAGEEYPHYRQRIDAKLREMREAQAA